MNVAIFLTAVGLIGLAPLVLVGVYAARRRSQEDAEHEQPSRSRIPIVVGVTAVLLLAGGGVAWTFSGPGAAPPAEGMGGMTGMDGGSGAGPSGEGSVPMELDGQPLTSYVDGPQAISDVARLHGSDFTMTEAEIATYGDGAITIWRSGTLDAAVASDQVERMRERIAGGTSPFEPPHELKARPGIYATTGMGQEHFFFAAGTSVWWVSASPAIAKLVLAEIVEGTAA